MDKRKYGGINRRMRKALDNIFQGKATIRQLTPIEKQTYDPHGEVSNRFKNMTDNNSIGNKTEFLTSPNAILERHVQELKMNLTTKHSCFAEFDLSQLKKVGRQGGNTSYDNFMPLLSKYYTPSSGYYIHPLLYRGRDILMAMIKHCIDHTGYPQVRTTSISGTFAGTPTCGHKGEFHAETEGMPHNPFFKFQPVIPWYRNYRNDVRVIFMDSNVNVKSTSWIFSTVRHYLSEHLPQYFDAWRNPDITLRSRMTNGVHKRAVSLEWDYEKMDTNVRSFIAMELLLPIYAQILKPYCSEEYLHVIFKQMFTVPLIIGEYLVEGEHSLFSGMNPTNDWETLYTVMLALGLLEHFNILNQPQIEVCDIFAMGDDMTMLLKGKKLQSKDYEELMNTAIHVSNTAGMKIHPLGTKSIIRDQGIIQFCRKMYYLSGRKDNNGDLYGAYPGTLLINSIINPEHETSSFARFCSATLQRLDGGIGAFYFPNVCRMVLHHIKSPFVTDAETLVLYRNRDWWERVYGEKWNPTSSPSYQLLVKEINSKN